MGWLKKILGGDDASPETSSQPSQSAQPPQAPKSTPSTGTGQTAQQTTPVQSQSQPQSQPHSPTATTTAAEMTTTAASAHTASEHTASAPETTRFSPLTDKRLEASIERLGWGEGTAFKNHDQGGGFWLLFDGVAALVTIPQPTAGRPTISVMAVIGEDKPIPKKRMAEALAWVNLQNNQTRFGTCLLGESINGLSLRVSCPVVLPLGATDAQLDSWLYNAVSCALQSALAANKYFFADSDKT